MELKHADRNPATIKLWRGWWCTRQAWYSDTRMLENHYRLNTVGLKEEDCEVDKWWKVVILLQRRDLIMLHACLQAQASRRICMHIRSAWRLRRIRCYRSGGGSRVWSRWVVASSILSVPIDLIVLHSVVCVAKRSSLLTEARHVQASKRMMICLDVPLAGSSRMTGCCRSEGLWRVWSC